MAPADDYWTRFARELPGAGYILEHLQRPPATFKGDPPGAAVISSDSCGPDGLFAAARALKKAAGFYLPVIAVFPAEEELSLVPPVDSPLDDFVVGRPSQRHVLLRLEHAERLKRLRDDLQAKNDQLALYLGEIHKSYNRVNGDLKLARRLQLSMLPPSHVQMPGVSFCAVNIPSGSVSGDFFDIFRLDETSAGFYVADAIGHGIAAALLGVFVKRGIKTKEITGKSYRIISPGEVLNALNHDIIAQNLVDNPFITMCYCVYDTITRKARVSSAGHPIPFLLRATGEVEELAGMGGPLLGVFDDYFEAREVELAVGDKLVIFSDGTENAGLLNRDRHGVEAFESSLKKHAKCKSEILIERVVEECFPRQYANLFPDDITMIAMQVE